MKVSPITATEIQLFFVIIKVINSFRVHTLLAYNVDAVKFS